MWKTSVLQKNMFLKFHCKNNSTNEKKGCNVSRETIFHLYEIFVEEISFFILFVSHFKKQKTGAKTPAA